MPRVFVGSMLIAVMLAVLSSPVASAGEADVVDAAAEPDGPGTWRFSVTVRHDDEGWEHYADLWQVLTPEGGILGERELLHPHVDEQPFTRSLSGVAIPRDLDEVVIRARDSRHGFTGRTLTLKLER